MGNWNEARKPPKVGIAFEYFEGGDTAPQKLWRVRYTRVFKQRRKLRCTEYFIDEAKAWKFAGDKTEQGYEVRGVDVYELNGEKQ